jgi:hypothetical protein
MMYNAEPAHDEVISHLDSNDTCMEQVVFANGKLWGTFGTGDDIHRWMGSIARDKLGDIALGYSASST